MLASQLGNVYVPFPEDLNPDHGNVIRRGGGGLVVRARAGNFVERSPNMITPDAESGYAFEYPANVTQQFYPDGRLGPRNGVAEDGLFGAGLGTATTLGSRVALFAGAAGAGALAGLAFSRRGRRARAAGVGALAGVIGGFGAILGIYIYGKATMV